MYDMIARQRLNRDQLSRRRERNKDYNGRKHSWHLDQMVPTLSAEELTRIGKQIKVREEQQRQRTFRLQLIVMAAILAVVLVIGFVAAYVWKLSG